MRESREKVSYADVERARSTWRSGREGRSVNEVLKLIGDALIASLTADEEELPQSRRVRSGIRTSREVEKLLGADIKVGAAGRQRRRKSGR
jgi:hypothetical protein